MGLALGVQPLTLGVRLTRGAALSATLRAQDTAGNPANWPAGATVRLELVPAPTAIGWTFTQSWAWTVTGTDAVLTVPAADTAALPVYPLHARIWIDNGGGDGEQLWAAGEVRFDA